MAGALVAISALPASTTILSTDIVPFVKSGTTDKITAGNLRTQMFAFAASDPLNCGVLTAVGNSTVTGTLSGVTTFTSSSLAISSAVGKLVPGATSFSLRNNADSADNVLITDAGLVTLRNNLAFSTASSRLIPGATNFSWRNAANSADNLLIADAGAITVRGSITGLTTVNASGLITASGGVNIAGGSFAAGTIYQSAGTGLTLSAIGGSGYDFQLINPAGSVGIIRVPTGTSTVLLAGSLQFSATNSKIIPGATNLSFRNTADGADNLVITDAGSATLRAGQTFTATTLVGNSATNLDVYIQPGNNASGRIAFRNNASAETVVISNGGAISGVAGLTIASGNLTFSAASGKIVPGATQLSVRDTADANDNLIIVNAGSATFRAAVTVGTNLAFTAAAAKILKGATSLSIRDSADTTDLMLFNASGITLAQELITTASLAGSAGLNIPHGTAPTSPVNGDMWTTTAGAFIRINGVTKTFTLT